MKLFVLFFLLSARPLLELPFASLVSSLILITPLLQLSNCLVRTATQLERKLKTRLLLLLTIDACRHACGLWHKVTIK